MLNTNTWTQTYEHKHKTHYDKTILDTSRLLVTSSRVLFPRSTPRSPHLWPFEINGDAIADNESPILSKEAESDEAPPDAHNISLDKDSPIFTVLLDFLSFFDFLLLSIRFLVVEWVVTASILLACTVDNAIIASCSSVGSIWVISVKMALNSK